MQAPYMVSAVAVGKVSLAAGLPRFGGTCPTDALQPAREALETKERFSLDAVYSNLEVVR